ncbi:MAG: hypothetical protein MJZ55_03190 [Paludibacteraceae bacterium]|nr:hypothetical protein [Paludibacteraceae bacterium]
MTYIDLIYKTDLHSGVPVVAEKSPFVFGDAQAHRITVMSTDGQRIEGSVTADFVNSAGDAATIVGDAENGKAVVVLPQWCYALPGAFALLVRVTDGTQTTTVLNLRGVVGQSYTSLGDVPDAVETTVAQLVARYDQKVAQQDKKIQQQDKQIEQLNEAIESKVKAT